MMVRDNLLEVQRAVSLFANRRQKEVVFELGASVWLNSVNLSSVHFARAERKLRNPFVGPFKVVERCSEYTYRLELTGKFRRMHPVFHAVMLKRAHVATEEEFPGRATLVADLQSGGEVSTVVEEPVETLDADGNVLYFVDEVLERRRANPKAKSSRKQWSYKVRWRGFGPADDTWITRDLVEGDEAMAMLKAFDDAQK
jgi:hypothetical protein